MDWTGIAAVITALGIFYQIVTTARRDRTTQGKVAVVESKVDVVESKVDEVHAEVKTANGITIAALSDRAEGRRVQEDITKEDRTTSEQGYVDRLAEKPVE